MACLNALDPDVDIFEQGQDVVIIASLPGLKKEDVAVTLDDGRLVLRGERRAEHEVQDEDYYWLERGYGSFYRVLPVPDTLTPEQVKASMKGGELTIRLPKAAFEQMLPSRITIN